MNIGLSVSADCRFRGIAKLVYAHLTNFRVLGQVVSPLRHHYKGKKTLVI
jgi:hypothetical protein